MTVQITIVGLGQIGASAGLALAAYKDQVTTVGHDKSPQIAQQAHKLAAVDRIEYNLPAAIENAGLVLLALPAGQIRPTLESAAQDVRPEAVVMDTCPAKELVAGWIKELLPPGRHYVGLTPAINPLYLDEPGVGINAAHADLFQHGLMGISAPPGTAGEALKLASDLASLLGAQPYYADPAEIDGLMASAHLLPQLAALALAGSLLDQPGWPDIRKLAGRAFAGTTGLFPGSNRDGLGTALLGNREHILNRLDSLLEELNALRADIAAGKRKELDARLEHARLGLDQWWAERSRADWIGVERGRPDLPKMGDIMKQQIGGLGKIFRRHDKPGGDE